MASNQYKIVLETNSPRKEKKRRFSFLKASFAILFLLCLSASLSANAYLLKFYKENKALEAYIAKVENATIDKEESFVALLADVDSLKQNLARVQQVNTKLALMANIEKIPNATSIGGANTLELGLGNIPLYRQEVASGKIRTFLRELEREAKLEEVQQQEILLAMRKNLHSLASLPTISPAKGFISSNFGMRNSPFTNKKEMHKGMDIAAPTGTPIIAPGDGVVTRISTGGAYGNLIEISHGSGLSTRYAHLHKFNVKEGQKVKRYDIIGFIGSTGRSTGPHLHYEVRLNGVATDPRLYILSSN